MTELGKVSIHGPTPTPLLGLRDLLSLLTGWFKGQVIEVEKCDFGRLESKGLGARGEHSET